VRNSALAVGLLASTLLSGAAFAAEVTAERLLNPEPENWLMPNLTYDSHRHSALDMINKQNVAGLRVVFMTAIGGLTGPGFAFGEGGHQSTPLADGGMLYIVDGGGVVYKVDASSGTMGRVVWVMDPGVAREDVWVPSNRGVSLYRNSVISVTGNGMVVWTNADTGEMLNSVQVEDPIATGYSLTAPPMAIGDKLIVPGSGGDRGARAHIDALNGDTGEAIWRTYSIPAPGEPGSETWKDDNNAWMHGGGSFWQVGSYDPELNLTYWGTGQPVPMYDPEYRPGDNLFTNSSLALNVDDGSIVWYFQYTPGDFLDYDEIGVQLLFDGQVNGEDRKVLGHFGRNGFYYNLDRTNGQFLNAGQYVDQLNWTAGIDPKTGKPVEYDPNADLQTYAIGEASRRGQGDITGCPNIQGGVNFMPTAFSPTTMLAYGAGIEGCSIVHTDQSKSPGPAQGGDYIGGSASNADRHTGSITAIDVNTGTAKAQRLFDYTSYSGVLSTAGGVVYTTTVDGSIFALDDTTLEVLWSLNTGTLSSAPPMSFGAGGKQYIAVLLGANGIAKGFLNKSPEMADIQNTSMLLVLGL